MDIDVSKNGFPAGFLWGAATAAFQIEGSNHADGRGESIWDRFCSTPGKVANGDTGEVACDHYRRWQDDVALLRELGVNAYRFSIAWPRIVPEGRGPVNHVGLDFYDRLTDALLESGITPFVTLYHWDLPQALQRWDGWANRDTIQHFARYTEVVAQRLGDRVSNWITHNEPAVVAFNGNFWGDHAPGLKNRTIAYQVAHNVLVSHGMAMQAIRATAPASKAGITLNLYATHPANDSHEDMQAAERADGFKNRWFLDPVFKGRYPEDILDLLGADAPAVEPGDMDLISTPIDFLGVNYYSRAVIRHAPNSQPFDTAEVKPDGSRYTDMNWEVYPRGLTETLERLHTEYPTPAYYVTENGATYPDTVSSDGRVHDTERRAYLQSHFEAAAEAISHGVPLKGYFVWSLMDNFEWAWGYTKRFGIIYIDYKTQERIWKDSALWYREWIEEHGSERAGK